MAGAFGSHALRDHVPVERLATFETGVRYQMYHALALFVAAWLATRVHARLPIIAGYLFIAGILIFSGSLYLLVFTGIGWWGAVTPVGGVAFISGWACLAMAAIQLRN